MNDEFEPRNEHAVLTGPPPVVVAVGSTNVRTFTWQAADPTTAGEFLAGIAKYGSIEFAAQAFPGDPDGVLTVTFLSGSTYDYAPVPLSVFVAMLNAPSRGRFVHYVLKQYPFSGPH